MRGAEFNVFPEERLPDDQIVPGAVAGVDFLLIANILIESGRQKNK